MSTSPPEMGTKERDRRTAKSSTDALPDQERLQDSERGVDQTDVREHAAHADQPVLGVDGDQGVNGVARPQLDAPATPGGRTTEAGRADSADLHRDEISTTIDNRQSFARATLRAW